MEIRRKMSVLRDLKGLSQAEMAEKLDVDINTYARIERGQTHVLHPKLSKIAELLNVDVLDLLADDKNVYLISDNSNHGCNVIGSSTEIAFEIQKLQMAIAHKDETINHKDEIIEQLRNENNLLKEMVALIKTNQNQCA